MRILIDDAPSIFREALRSLLISRPHGRIGDEASDGQMVGSLVRQLKVQVSSESRAVGRQELNALIEPGGTDVLCITAMVAAVDTTQVVDAPGWDH